MTIYEMTQGVSVLEGEPYCSYGIRCGGMEIADISCDREKLAKLVDLCNHLALDPIHLRDVVEDFLAEESAWR